MKNKISRSTSGFVEKEPDPGKIRNLGPAERRALYQAYRADTKPIVRFTGIPGLYDLTIGGRPMLESAAFGDAFQRAGGSPNIFQIEIVMDDIGTRIETEGCYPHGVAWVLTRDGGRGHRTSLQHSARGGGFLGKYGLRPRELARPREAGTAPRRRFPLIH